MRITSTFPSPIILYAYQSIIHCNSLQKHAAQTSISPLEHDQRHNERVDCEKESVQHLIVIPFEGKENKFTGKDN